MSNAAAARLERLVSEMVAQRAVTAAAALTGDVDGVAASAVAGWARPEAGAGLAAEDLFDLASLTKPVMATLALILDAEGVAPLTTRLGSLFPNIARPLAPVTLEDLLRHRGGLAPWAPLYARSADREAALELLLSGALVGPAGRYGDLGHILWGFAVERLAGRPLAALVDAHLGDWLGETVAAAPPAERSVACRMDTRREVELAAEQGLAIDCLPAPALGQTQDGNARFLGGLSGHAGLFGAVEGLWRLAREWLAPGSRLDPAAVAKALAGPGPLLAGWGRPAAWPRSAAGFGPAAFGHPGFTGGAVWAEPETGRIAVLLAHRTAELPDVAPWQRRLAAPG